jgi:redox-sensing transcriptional repressor
MGKPEHIPSRTIRRLSLYLRQLETFHAGDRRTVSSKELGQALNISDAQVRKDFAYFGQFGHPGIGYRVPELIHRVRRILGTDRVSNVLLVGVGNLGRALLAFRGFKKRGFEIVAAFDNDPTKLGAPVNALQTLQIRPMSELSETVRTHSVRVGILSVNGSAAQAVADAMVESGLRAILNFAPVHIQVSPGISVASVDLAVQLEQLSYQINGPIT